METLKIFGKNIKIYVDGIGSIPLLVLGQASLFRINKFIPNELRKIFKIYYVDFFEKSDVGVTAYHKITLDAFVYQIEMIRKYLKLKKVALFGHSAAGIMAIEYARRYDNVLFNVIVATAPVWGKVKDLASVEYFDTFAASDRKILYQKDQEVYEDSDTNNGSFIEQYNRRRCQFYYDPKWPRWEIMWRFVEPDDRLIRRYFECINDYDITKSCTIETPTLLVLGLFDFSSPHHLWAASALNMLESKYFYIFEHSGHYPMYEESELFVKYMLGFLIEYKFLRELH